MAWDASRRVCISKPKLEGYPGTYSSNNVSHIRIMVLSQRFEVFF